MKGAERYVTNTGGSRLLEELGSLRADVKSLQSNVEKHEAGFRALLDVRERAFLTWLRDFWRDHGAGSKAGPSVPLKARVQSLNQSIIHGGYAIVDALMVKQKGLPYEEEFTELYGLSPSDVEYIGNVASILPGKLPISLLLMPIPAAKQYNTILQVLNAVGTFRFAGWYLRKLEKEIFDRVVMLARERRWEEAEQAATDFPFVPGFVQLQNVDGED
jgi:hypothetical protein